MKSNQSGLLIIVFWFAHSSFVMWTCDMSDTVLIRSGLHRGSVYRSWISTCDLIERTQITPGECHTQTRLLEVTLRRFAAFLIVQCELVTCLICIDLVWITPWISLQISEIYPRPHLCPHWEISWECHTQISYWTTQVADGYLVDEKSRGECHTQISYWTTQVAGGYLVDEKSRGECHTQIKLVVTPYAAVLYCPPT